MRLRVTSPRLAGRPEVRGVQLALKGGLAAGERSGRAGGSRVGATGAGGQRGEGALAKQKWGMGVRYLRVLVLKEKNPPFLF